MRRLRKLALGASSLALVVSAAGGGSVLAQDSAPPVRIGSDNFYESRLMAEIYAQALEAAGFTVERQLGLGSRPERAPAFEAGQVDLVPEYVGSGLGYYTIGAEDPALAELATTGDGETNRANLQAAYDALGIGATVLGITPGEDTNAIVVRQDTADEFGLASVADLAAVQEQLRLGPPARMRCQRPVQWRAPAVRHHLSAGTARGARRLRRADGRCARRQRDRRRAALLDPAGDRPAGFRRPRGRPRHPARREPRSGRAQRLSRPGRGRAPRRSPPSSIRCPPGSRPRS